VFRFPSLAVNRGGETHTWRIVERDGGRRRRGKIPVLHPSVDACRNSHRQAL